MAASSGPNLGVSYGWAARESGWNAGMDANLKLLDALLQLSVKSRAVAVPPGTPANGDRYIVGASPSGAWAGKAAQVAVRIEGAWTFFVPKIRFTWRHMGALALSALFAGGSLAQSTFPINCDD